MNLQTPESRHEALIGYLLEVLTEEERQRVEALLMTDRDFQEALEAAEADLADRSLNRELLPEHTELLNRKFAGSPEWSEAITFARIMSRAETDLFARESRAFGGIRRWVADFFASRYRGSMMLVFSGIVIVALVVSVWFAGPRRNPAPVTPTATFVLMPAGLKGGSPTPENIVRLPERPGLIELRLVLQRNLYASYQVQLESTDTGAQTQLGAAVATQRDGVTEVRISVPSSILNAGRYTIVLRAAEVDGTVSDVAGYSFRLMM